MRKRMHQIKFRLDDEELLLLKRNLKSSGYSMSEYFRVLMQNGEIKIVSAEVMQDIRKQIRGVGRNINQIARLAHISGKVSMETLKDIAAAQEKLEHQLGRLL